MPLGLLAGFLVVYGNASSLLRENATPADPRPGLLLSVLLVAVVLVWARAAGLRPDEIGVLGPGLLRSAGVGLLVALVAGGAALLFLRFPPLVGGPVDYTPLDVMARDALFWRVLVWMPLDTALPEELAFRGVLLAGLRRRVTAPWAAALSAAVFVPWHGVVVMRTVAASNLAGDPLLLGLGLAGAYAAVFVGGLLFAWLRLTTGHLAGSVVAHWAFNAALLLGLGLRPG